MGHALRLLVSREHQLDGTVEMDEFYIGAGRRKGADYPRLGRGRKGQPRTTKTPVLAVVKRPAEPLAPDAISKSPVPKVPAGGCPEEGRTRFKRRTGVELDDINRITGWLMDTSGLRNTNHWHTAVPQDLFYSPDCTTVTYIYGADAVPDVAGRRHPSAAIVKGCGEM